MDEDVDGDTPVQVLGESDPAPATTSAKTSDAIKEEETDDDEEEFLIMADIGHDIDQQTVLEHAAKSEIHAINIDGTNPFIQIGPYTFQGQYNYVLGTNLFFSTTTTTGDHKMEETPSTSTHTNDLHLIGLSDKKLNLSRVYIYPKTNDDSTNS